MEMTFEVERTPCGDVIVKGMIGNRIVFVVPMTTQEARKLEETLDLHLNLWCAGEPLYFQH